MKFVVLNLIFIGVLYAAADKVLINGLAHEQGVSVNATDSITTNRKTRFRFNIKKDAFMLTPSTSVEFYGKDGMVKGFKVLTGGVLAVFSKGGVRTIQTKTITAGIRGTGFYIEQNDDRTYFCNCYGTIDLSTNDGSYKETLVSTHHNARDFNVQNNVYEVKNGTMHDHTDDELRALEQMVGGVVPFD